MPSPIVTIQICPLSADLPPVLRNKMVEIGRRPWRGIRDAENLCWSIRDGKTLEKIRQGIAVKDKAATP